MYLDLDKSKLISPKILQIMHQLSDWWNLGIQVSLDTNILPQNHEKWRFYTPKIWVITPKNEGCGFPWWDWNSKKTVLDLESNDPSQTSGHPFWMKSWDSKHTILSNAARQPGFHEVPNLRSAVRDGWGCKQKTRKLIWSMKVSLLVQKSKRIKSLYIFRCTHV